MKNRKTLGTAFAIVALIAAVWASGAVLAQRGPGGPGGPGDPGGHGAMMPPPGPRTGAMEAGDSGLFVLAGPTLVRYSPDLAEQDTVQLLDATRTSGTAAEPPACGAMLIVPAEGDAAEKLLVVIGDKFFAVDAQTLGIIATGTLPDVELPADQQTTAKGSGKHGPAGPPPGPGALEYHDAALYVQRGPAIIAVNVEDGSVMGQATLPKPPAE